MRAFTPRMQPGLVVRYEGRTGVTVPDFMNCCSDEETPVIFEGQNSFQGVDTTLLEFVHDERPIANPDKCGAGKGAACCIFLTASARGCECVRHQSFRYTMQARAEKMHAKRQPVRLFPACQQSDDGMPK